MTTILSIDPGPDQSAWMLFNDKPVSFNILSNVNLLALMQHEGFRVDAVVIEQVQSFGMPVGAEVFETVFWSGRFAEAAYPIPVDRIGRKVVKLHLCGSPAAKDSNIRQALIDRFGGPDSIRKGGVLYGISKDVWSALAVAVTWSDKNGRTEPNVLSTSR